MDQSDPGRLGVGDRCDGRSLSKLGTAVEAFLTGIKLASETFLVDPLGVPMISNRSRVAHASPGIFRRLVLAVEEDHEWEPANGLGGRRNRGTPRRVVEGAVSLSPGTWPGG